MKHPVKPEPGPDELNEPAYPSSTPIELSGRVERITYGKAGKGFMVIRLRIPGYGEPVTVVGDLMGVAPGVCLKLKGHWSDHPRFGRQFQAQWSQPEIPATLHDIESYLGSGVIRGIGPKLAERIVSRFGAEAVDILSNHQERLLEIDGIGPAKLAGIKKSWDKHNDTHDVMLFLQSLGIGPALAARLLKTYASETTVVVRNSPFQLAEDVSGVGFLTADRIAQRLGFAPDHPQRIQAGILHVLHLLSEEGHIFYPHQELTARVRSILKTEDGVIAAALDHLERVNKIIIENLAGAGTQPESDLRAVYLAPFYRYEAYIARTLRLLARAPVRHPHIHTRHALNWVQQMLKIRLAPAQAQAVHMAMTEKVLIITGGPGTGKTTIIQAIVRIFERLGDQILLAAPTGRAAKRMSAATGRPAKTIHRLLEFSPMEGGFQRHDNRPLDCDLLVVDEFSMVDSLLMYHLLKAVSSNTTLIMVGDHHQLPSVGPGNVLQDIIVSRFAPVVTLTKIFRQVATGRIVENAHRINSGQMPVIETDRQSSGDFYFIHQTDPAEIVEIILKVTAERIPQRFGLDPVDDIQVLTPMHKGLVGTANLNRRLQAALNPADAFVRRGDQYFHLNDKVMQIRNNYTKEIFNGDIGRITNVNAAACKLTICFDDHQVEYEYSELEDIIPAYAISIHKSQGSEYPAVVIPVTTQHYVMLQRNLLYTAVTRGKRLVVLVGDQRAMAMAVKNNAPQQRHTSLARRLAGEFETEQHSRI